MAAADTEYSFLWVIQKYSYTGNSVWLDSPWSPIADGLEGTSWGIKLCPNDFHLNGLSSLFLQRNPDDDGPETFSVKLELSVLTVYGSVIRSEQCEHTFRKGSHRHFYRFLDMSELYVREKPDFLPQDALGLRCRMWRDGGRVREVTQHTARFLITTEKICFEHKIRKFSAIKLYKKNRTKIRSQFKDGCIYSSDLWISTKYLPEGSIVVDVESSFRGIFLIGKQISVRGVAGKIIKLSEVDYRFKDRVQKEEEMRVSLTRQFFLDRKSEFLPNDKLTLLVECTFYLGYRSSEIQKTQHEFPVPADQNESLYPQARNDTKELKKSAIKKSNIFEKGLPSLPTALDEFKALYKDQLLMEVQNESSPADKTLVCARSSASRSMFRKEKNTYCVKVAEPEDEIGRALILFLYSDSLKYLRWGSTLQIYHDASNYAVKSLKILSSYFLVDNLSTTNASQLLLLADLHADKQLKEIVENFILKHEQEVFSSKEWEKFGKTNPQLGMETMLLKYKRGKTN